MAYTNQILAVAAVVFLAVAIAPLLAEPQSPMFPNMTPECASVMPDLLEKCFATGSVTPTEDCCSDLKSATTTQVTCLCDNYIANPAVVNITGPYSAAITTKCGVFDKYSCDGTSKVPNKNGTFMVMNYNGFWFCCGKGGETGSSSSSNSSNTNNGKDNSTSEGNGGATNKIATSMAVFGLIASLVFVMF